jgi:hypothetical protein
MAVNPNNVVQGPATIYWGQFGTTEPADTNGALIASPPGGWTDMGATTGGVTVTIEHTYGQIKADQLVDTIGARLTGRVITVMVNLLEATLQNLLVAMNQAANITTLSGVTTFDPVTATSATQPTYTALLVDGWAPLLGTGAAARRRLIVRKLLSDVKASAKYDLVTQVTWDCSFTAYYVSPSIAPFHIQDQTA